MANKINEHNSADYRDVLWNERFEKLKKFKKRYGHCDVPQSEKRFQSLATWCVKQRIYKKFQRLKVPDERITKLNSIGFTWNILDKIFNERFDALKKYYKKHDHCKVTKKQDAVLFKWCTKLRQEKKKQEPRLTKDRIKKLDSINFEWEIIDDRWITSYNALKKHVEKKKQIFDFSDKHKQIFSFIHNCRVASKAGRLTKDQIDLLNKIGFIWNVYDDRWDKRFEELKKYKKTFGHCNVSQAKRDKDYKELAEWASEQRNNYKNKSQLLNPERIKKLSSLGFSWKPAYKIGEQNRISDTDMLNELKRLNTLLGKTPSILDINKYGRYNSVSYYNHFGNIRNARKKAGLESVIK